MIHLAAALHLDCYVDPRPQSSKFGENYSYPSTRLAIQRILILDHVRPLGEHREKTTRSTQLEPRILQLRCVLSADASQSPFERLLRIQATDVGRRWPLHSGSCWQPKAGYAARNDWLTKSVCTTYIYIYVYILYRLKLKHLHIC